MVARYSYRGASFGSCRGDTVALVSVDLPLALLYSILLGRSSVELFLARWTFQRNRVSEIFCDIMQYLSLQCVNVLQSFTFIVWITTNGNLVKIPALLLLEYLLRRVSSNRSPING